MLIIFGALKIELENIIRHIEIRRTSRKNGALRYSGIIEGEDVHIVLTGIGKDNTVRALSDICCLPGIKKAKRVKVLVTGFCGAAGRKLQIGDPVIYSKVIYIPGKDTSGTIEGTAKFEDQILPSSRKVPETLSGIRSGCLL